VNGHVSDRLSTFLDGELEAREREAVTRHLEACAECARLLEELAAVDRLASAEPAPAPDEGFVSRVRARIRAPQAVRPGFALPRWALAAAAALVVAAVAPLLLQRQKSADAPSLARLEEQRARPPAPPPTTAPVAAAPGPASAPPGEADLRSQGYASEAAREPRANVAGEERGKREPGVATQAAAPSAAPERGRLRDALAPTSELVVAEDETRVADRPAAGAGALAAKERAVPAAPPPAAAREAAGFAEAPAEGARDQAQAGAAMTEVGGAAAAREPPALRKSVAGPSAAFRSLASRPAATIAEARGLREAWRAFAGGAVGSEADDARVRMIETGLLAYRLSAEAVDLEVARRDAAAYLRREDAAQKDRVRALIAAVR